MNFIPRSPLRPLGYSLLMFLVAASANALTLTVNSTADAGGSCPGNDCTLRQAIAAASAGATIVFGLPANSAITLTSAELLVNKNLTITGPGASQLSIQRSTTDGTPNFRILNVASGTVTVSGLRIALGKYQVTDSSKDGGGGILNTGILTLNNVIVSDNLLSPFRGRGGGIFNRGSLTINSSTVTNNNSGQSGGGIETDYKTSLAIANSTISGNSAEFGGAIAYDQMVTATITNTTLSGNKGGAIYNFASTVTITNATIASNTNVNAAFDNWGGGVYNQSGTIILRNSIIASNTAPGGTSPEYTGTLTSQGYNFIGNSAGAAISPAGGTTGDQIGTAGAPKDPKLGPLQDNGGPTQTQALLSNSTALDAGDSGGATTDQRGLPRPVDSSAVPNASGGDGSDIGAYEVQADTLTGCTEINTVVHNNGDAGTGSLRSVIAAVCAGSNITFDATVRGAVTLTSGELAIAKSLNITGPGANLLRIDRSSAAGTPAFRVFNISSAKAIVAISGLTISNGSIPGDRGGGILNSGTLTLTSDAVAGNSSVAGNGGGAYTSGTLILDRTTFSGNKIDSNTIAGSGGAIFNFGGTLTITNSTFSANSALGPANGDHGGAIFSNVGSVSILSSTFSANASNNGGGVYGANGAVVKISNSIVALNTATAAAPDVFGPLTSQGFNLIGDGSGATITPSQFPDQVGVTAAELNLGPLQDNGGPTMTHALMPRSRAIDKGNSSGLTTDQRGLARPSDDPAVPNATSSDGSDIGAYEFQVPTPTPTQTPTPASQLLNLSTRKQVGAGDNVLIGGFIVVGVEDKKVLVRGLGPSLPVGGALADPTLEIHAADTTLLAANNNWKDTQQAEISATGIPPANDLESAVVFSLAAKPAGNGGAGYTAILAGSGGGTGIGLLEIYDLATAAGSKLANISTRGFVGTNDDVLIGGFIPGPSDRTALKVLLRGLGPSLGAQGVNGALQDPLLELHDGNGNTLATNDSWKSDQQAAIEATGIPPTDDREAAIVTTVAPSNSGYTAVVRGVANSTGVALVEVYALQ